VIVVDTSALLAILNKEPERDHFLDILANDERPMVSAAPPRFQSRDALLRPCNRGSFEPSWRFKAPSILVTGT
jgi:hypothetical protein